ncbi:MAG: transglycosylase domain-containing protein [Proteobacteria bacterium]|nr:transglycosylase domain-containing protein [Pseudomonadota bacterium]
MLKKVNIKLKYVVITAFFLFIFLPMILGLVWLNSYGNLFPDSKFSRNTKERLMRSPTVFVDRNNKQLGSIGGSKDFHIQTISASTHDLSTLAKILFAKEDRKIGEFDGIQHSGLMGIIEASMEVISWKGKLRAVVQTFGGNTQGASGLLEQIAGNLFAHDNHNPWFRSGILSQVERKLVKTINAIRLAKLYQNSEQVVEDYVNLTYSAGMYHGINAFMLQRFNRPIDQVLVPINLSKAHLTDEEINIINMLAYYVGQLTGPSNYDPGAARNPIARYRILKRAAFKKDLVLNQMFDLGMIQKTVYLKAKDRELPFNPGTIAKTSYNPNIEVLRRETIDQIKINLGGKVKTTLVKEIQDFVSYELLKKRTALSIKATGTYIPSRAPLLKSIRPKLYGIYRVKVVSRKGNRVTVNLGIRIGNRKVVIPEKIKKASLKYLAPGKYISVGIDGFDSKGLPQLSLVQTEPFIKGAALVKDLSNSQVVAFGGGSYLKAAISPGSAFKPFLLKMAFDYGWQLEDRLNNGCFLKYRMFGGPYYSPKNYGRCDESKVGFERYPEIKTVLKKSINKPVVYLLDHLTDQLTENEFRNMADRIIKPYQDDSLKPGEFAYLVRGKSIDFYRVAEDKGKQFVGKISTANLKNELIFEQLKREKYLALNEENRYLEAAEVLDQGYREFMRWHAVINDANEQISKLKAGLEAYREGNLSESSSSLEVASLYHFYYDENKNLHYDPYSRDRIAFINWELVDSFLKERSLAGTLLGKFTLDDHQRYDNWVEDYAQLPADEFFTDMYYFHPQVRGLVNIVLFKAYLSDLTGTDQKSILGDYSLPLGTHRVSLVKLSEMYGQVLTYEKDNEDIRNNRTFFIEPDKPGSRDNFGYGKGVEFVLDEETDVFAAMKAARQEKGGTSFHLKSKEIVAGKTGTDPKYKTYAAVVKFNGTPYLVTAWFGPDHNKHVKLVKPWTAGWTAALYVDKVVSTIQKRYADLLPKRFEDSIEFDPDFEYDATPDPESLQPTVTDSADSTQKKEPTVVWQADGTYKMIYEDDKPEAEEDLEPTVEMDYSEEDIDRLIENESLEN